MTKYPSLCTGQLYLYWTLCLADSVSTQGVPTYIVHIRGFIFIPSHLIQIIFMFSPKVYAQFISLVQQKVEIKPTDSLQNTIVQT